MSQLQVFSNSPIKASSMIGTDVVNPNGDNLGDVKEVVIDPRTGRVAYAVVSFGGFGFAGGEYHLVYGGFTVNKSWVASKSPVIVARASSK